MNQLATQNQSRSMIIQEDSRLNSEQVIQQVALIQNIMSAVMKNDEHYGIIPGTGNKKSLYKSGAEKICLTFRLSASYGVEETKLENGHREYRVVTTLTHINSGICYGQGVGLCSTMESKFRYRKVDNFEPTGQPIPKDWWKDKDINSIGGKGFAVKKVDDVYQVVKLLENKKQENPDIADTYNTVLKMAKKRSYVDAVISATSASDIFTQDVEDFVDMSSDSYSRKQNSTPKDNKGAYAQQNKTAAKGQTPYDKAKEVIVAATNMAELKSIDKYTKFIKGDDEKSEITILYKQKAADFKKEFEAKKSINPEQEESNKEWLEGFGNPGEGLGLNSDEAVNHHTI